MDNINKTQIEQMALKLCELKNVQASKEMVEFAEYRIREILNNADIEELISISVVLVNDGRISRM